MIKETQSFYGLIFNSNAVLLYARPFVYEFLFPPAHRYTVGNKTRTQSSQQQIERSPS